MFIWLSKILTGNVSPKTFYCAAWREICFNDLKLVCLWCFLLKRWRKCQIYLSWGSLHIRRPPALPVWFAPLSWYAFDFLNRSLQVSQRVSLWLDTRMPQKQTSPHPQIVLSEFQDCFKLNQWCIFSETVFFFLWFLNNHSSGLHACAEPWFENILELDLKAHNYSPLWAITHTWGGVTPRVANSRLGIFWRS